MPACRCRGVRDRRGAAECVCHRPQAPEHAAVAATTGIMQLLATANCAA